MSASAVRTPSPRRPISSTIARGPSSIANWQLNLRLAALSAAITIVMLPLFGSMVDAVGDQTPTSLSIAALPIALLVALHGLRSEPDPSHAYPARSADVVIAACLFVPGAAVLRYGPTAFGWSAGDVHLELIGIALVVASFVALLLGSRTLWLTRRAFFLLVAACPFWYGWLVPAVERLGLDVGWGAIKATASTVGVASTVTTFVSDPPQPFPSV